MRKFSLLTAALMLGAAPAWATVTDAGHYGANHFGDYLSAQVAAGDHDMAAAADLYRATLATDPNNVDLLNRALFFTVGAGDMDEAVTLARHTIKDNPGDRLSRTVLIIDAFRESNYADARMQIAQSNRGASGELLLYLLDAWASEGQGDTKQALADLKIVTDQGGGANVVADYNRALILDLANQNADADAAYKQAVISSGHASRVVEAYGRFLERQGRADDARAFYASMAGDPATSQVAAYGLARLQSGRKPDRLVSTPAEGAAEVVYGFASLLTDAVNADLAILYLRMGLALSPHHDAAKLLLADRLETVDKVDEAIKLYRSIDKGALEGANAQVLMAIDESRLDHNDQAIADLKRYTSDNPVDVDGWMALGDIQRSAEHFPEAVSAYDQAVKLHTPPTSKDWQLYFARGVAQERAKNWTAAENDLQESLKLSPDQAQVLNYLGYSWVDQNRRLPEAIAMLEKARALSPFDGFVVDSVGWAYYRLGRYQDAANTLLEAVKLEPGDPTVNEHLGDAFWKVGRKLDARFQWNHALAFGPAADQKTQIEEKLKDGLGGRS
ncbi:MAG TPA: tetratricopeptide repeat protein [Rhizomicrobium sp.]